ncbi:MAG: hypothetical protein QME77_10665 [bacterium]|nr:hypothetical protein [bacterium]
MRTKARQIAYLLVSAGLILTAAAPALSSPVSLTEVRPSTVLVGASVEVSLIGAGFGPNCGAWVRAADIAEQPIPAILRSATQMTVLVGGELTNRPRTLESQVRCTYTTVAGTRIDSTEWRPLTVVRLVIYVTPPPPIGLRPTAPSDVRFQFDIPSQVLWRDNSTNERGFYIYIDGRRWVTTVSPAPMVTGTGWRNYTLGEWDVRLPRCGRDIVIGVSAYNSFGESAQATTTFRWRPCP